MSGREDLISRLLDRLSDATWSVVIVILFALLAWRLKSRPSRRVEAAGETFTLPQAVVMLTGLIVFALAAPPAYRALRTWLVENFMERGDPNRLVLVVPDFAGEGEADAADTVHRMLRTSLGTRIQVLRVPALKAGDRYGDTDREVDVAQREGLFCAAQFHGDVVVWGTNHPSSGQVSVSFTAKEPDCHPSNCGVTGFRYPRLFKLEDADQSTSEIAQSLSRGAVVALGLATRRGGGGVQAASCLDRPDVARRFAAKADALLAGGPGGLSANMTEAAVGYGAHQRQLELDRPRPYRGGAQDARGPDRQHGHKQVGERVPVTSRMRTVTHATSADEASAAALHLPAQRSTSAEHARAGAERANQRTSRPRASSSTTAMPTITAVGASAAW